MAIDGCIWGVSFFWKLKYDIEQEDGADRQPRTKNKNPLKTTTR